MAAETCVSYGMGDASPVIELKAVNHAFTNDVWVLRDINLSVGSGERLAIVGPSGAGKSTLLRTMNGLVTPTSGEVWVLGQCLNKMQENARRLLRRQIGMVFQEFALVERLSVLTNVLIGRLGYVPLGPSLVRLFPAQDIARARAALEEVGLGALESRQVRHLSGGQKQRVGIARAIVQEPRLILADEPTANLDVRTADDVLKMLVEVGRKHETTVVLNLHDVRAARRFCDNVVGLRHGQVVWQGPASAFGDAEVETVFYAPPEDAQGP